MVTLSERLSAIAALIKKGDRVADIGTDHAYLPIYLRQHGISPYVLACDIGALPLESAKKNVTQSGMDGIDFRLCDGLQGISFDEVDTIVIAGMGGECISGILERCAWAKDSGKHFILQPMNSPEELRRFLNGDYTLLSERAVKDAGRIYTVMEVVAEKSEKRDESTFIYTGLLNPALPLDREFLQKQYKRLRDCADSLKDVKNEEKRFASLCEAVVILKNITEV